MGQPIKPEISRSRWRGFYKLGGVAALVIAALLIGEIVVYAVLPRASTALEHFTIFRDNWLAGLLTFDLLGMIAYLLFVPLAIALYVALRRTGDAVMAIGTVLFFIGIAAFFATNTAFSILSLSQQYAAATTDAERAVFLAAGQTMLTLFNENAFLVSYVIVSAAWVMISSVMLKSSIFNRITAYAGILAGAAGIVAVVLEHASATQAVLIFSISFYFAAIVFLFVWVVLAGLRLYHLGSNCTAGL
jgi:hypothetical protein